MLIIFTQFLVSPFLFGSFHFYINAKDFFFFFLHLPAPKSKQETSDLRPYHLFEVPLFVLFFSTTIMESRPHLCSLPHTPRLVLTFQLCLWYLYLLRGVMILFVEFVLPKLCPICSASALRPGLAPSHSLNLNGIVVSPVTQAKF